jgi:hypothetical protein
MTWTKQRLLGGLLLLLILGFWFTTSFAQVNVSSPNKNNSGLGQQKDTQKDLDELHKLTGTGNVTVHLLNNPTSFKGRIKGFPQIMGRNFLQLQTDNTPNILVNVDAIAAIKQDF